MSEPWEQSMRYIRLLLPESKLLKKLKGFPEPIMIPFLVQIAFNVLSIKRNLYMHPFQF